MSCELQDCYFPIARLDTTEAQAIEWLSSLVQSSKLKGSSAFHKPAVDVRAPNIKIPA